MGDVPRILNIYVQNSFVVTLKKKKIIKEKKSFVPVIGLMKKQNYTVHCQHGINFRSSSFGFDSRILGDNSACLGC